MAVEQEHNMVSYDARQHFAAQINYRIGVYLDARIRGGDFRDNVECLTDLHDLVRAWYNNDVDQEVESMLKEIELLLWREGITPIELRTNRPKARVLIRKTFNKIMKEIKRRGLLLPLKEEVDELDDFENS